MVALALLLLFAADPISPPSASAAQTPSAKDQAEGLAAIGHNELHLGRLADAQANCDAALKLDPANGTAKDCLHRLAVMLVDQDLNKADASLLQDKKSEAAALASNWARAGYRADQRVRAWDILDAARISALRRIVNALLPTWLRETLVTIVILTVLWLILLALRRLWREWERGKWYGSLTNTTKWSMLPFNELPAPADGHTSVATNIFLDALSRLGHELRRKLWQPKLLLLKPTRPADYEPALIDGF